MLGPCYFSRLGPVWDLTSSGHSKDLHELVTIQSCAGGNDWEYCIIALHAIFTDYNTLRLHSIPEASTLKMFKGLL